MIYIYFFFISFCECSYNNINEIKNYLQGINSKMTEAEERISDLEEKILEITTAEQNKEKEWKN